jgi:PhnB protein
MNNKADAIPTAIAPWLSVRNGAAAVAFYKAAFSAIETYRLEPPGGGLVVKLSVNRAEFWISSEGDEKENTQPETVGGGTVRMILVVEDPETFFTAALAAGSTEVFPVGEGHGWKLGRIIDPFGLHWEIGHQLE